MADDEPKFDVAVNVYKGADGYGIYFTCKDGEISVTKLDPNSEAMRSGVQPGDRLVSVQDLDKKLPLESPGSEVDVSPANYRESLELVRNMKYCRLAFKSPGF
jgi:C-terminal processing protease CtpA/Prc